ncbi:Clavaminate synthase-like protein [Myriangium duriaei CBS 260.36]|uniref:Clavaminate synthase-like protein n=1 Tax=Myriangium duriaei CBS 260.36 TaxID=1168546 RepID=A0A9P4MCV8_9PEZI|nr:Clavaminate synthase-like protein [Myriangium duriaei CBS 260.36]
MMVRTLNHLRPSDHPQRNPANPHGAEMDDIPVIDFSPFLQNDVNRDSKFHVCEALLRSLQQHGVAKLANHGVSYGSVEEMFNLSKEFFDLPAEFKQVCAHPSTANPHRGFCHVGLEKTYGATGFERGLKDPLKVHDVKESFDVGSKSDSLYHNRWPEESALPGFRARTEDFFDECHQSLCHIMDALALGLGLEPRSLAALHSAQDHELRLLHYPAIDPRLLDGSRLRIAEHTDFGTLTLLFQDSVGGLEVEAQHSMRTKAEVKSVAPFRAIDAHAPIMIVNIGDSLERWTNSALRAVVHRVTKPQPINDTDTVETLLLPPRYSIAFFGKPDRTQSLKPLSNFVTAARPAIWPEISAHAYNQSKLVRQF